MPEMYALTRLAVVTESTRLTTVFRRLTGFTPRSIPGVGDDGHARSHRVGRQGKIDELAKRERAKTARLAGLLSETDHFTSHAGTLNGMALTRRRATSRGMFIIHHRGKS